VNKPTQFLRKQKIGIGDNKMKIDVVFHLQMKYFAGLNKKILI
jgi:hypothetical protein